MSIDTFLLSADTTDLNYPEVRPTLDLNFARVKALDPRITFTRSSGGSYVGADGLIKLAGVNQARFDHDQNTGESLGLLVEESRTNLLLRSEEFDNASWSKIRSSVTANSTIAPDGTTTAEKLIEDTSTTTDHFINLNPSGSTSATYTASIFIKSAERYRIRFQIIATGAAGNRASAWFDSNTGSVVSTLAEGNGSIITTSIQQYPNGWYRCILTGIPSTAGSGTAVNFNVTLNTTSTNTVYTGDGTSGLYIWGAQIEAGSFPTSYIPTVASTRTRAADNASMTGKNFSDWYRQDEGSINIAYRLGLKTASTRIFQINNSATGANNVLDIVSGSGVGSGGYLFINTNNVQEGFVPNSTPNESHRNTVFKVCAGYKTNDIAGINNKTRILGTDTSVIIPTGMNRVVFAQSDFSSLLCGHLQYVQYYPKRLPDAQLQVLTR